MVNKKIISQYAKRLFKGKKQPKDRQLMHPNREWFTGIGVGLMIFIASAAWSAQTYLQYQNVDIESGLDDQASEVAYRDTQVKAALELFDIRAETLESLLSNSAPPEVEIEPEVATTTTEVQEGVQDIATTTESDRSTSTEIQ